MTNEAKIRLLYAKLFPTGRAWQFVRGSEDREGLEEVFTDGLGITFTDGLGMPFGTLIPEFIAPTGKRLVDSKLKAFDQAYTDAIGIQNTTLPDNSEFDEQDATNWERALLLPSNITDLELRKQRIERQLYYPAGIVERSHYKFIEEQIRAAGFDVYIIENRFWNGSAFEIVDPDLIGTQDVELGIIELGNFELGGEIAGVNYTEIIANFVDSAEDANYFSAPPTNPLELGDLELGVSELGGGNATLPREKQLQASFFIGGSSFPSIVDVDINRKDEFRQLVLKLKPLQTLCFAYINYV